ncbi:DNA-binding response regulator [Actinoalloteichus sp. AHMU CJ021]|uniref:response regulator n=1 Tax=Actinoalloteichus TaxID=65496 RepID=UPI0003757224|nr:response regulator transcription factor [Actinoalloteichus spitiensis]AUS81118.1 DNA-binding response regulator [Actinoalloteichus sp. AHMU CJ021]
MIRVLVADDQPLIRGAFQVLLDREPDIEVVAQAGNGLEAVELTRRHRPSVVLLDVRMPLLDGISAARRIIADPELAPVSVVILTNYALDEYLFSALRAGVSGFLVKDSEPAELIHAVRVADRGDAVLAPSVTRRLVEEFAARPPTPAPPPELDGLTVRERQVLALVGAGLSNAEIARELTISHLTAKTHVSRIMTKVGVRDRARLVVLAYESGLVVPGRRISG